MKMTKLISWYCGGPIASLLKLIAFIFFTAASPMLGTLTAMADDHILILYDSAGPYGHIGKEHGILLTNLLGHFPFPVISKPVSSYSIGEMHVVPAVFYIGTTYDERSYYDPDSVQWKNYNDFLSDAAVTNVPLVWLNYNLNQLQEMLNDQDAGRFAQKFGFIYAGVVDKQYNRVFYKDTELLKGVVPFANPGADVTGCIEEGGGRYACSTELNTITILNFEKVRVYAQADSTLTVNAETPYISRSGNFWFVGDLPFEYLSEEDRYLAFSDILHDMLGVYHAETHKALVRLEDVSTMTSVQDLAAVADYLSEENIPFSIATIAFYKDSFLIDQSLYLSSVGSYLKSLERNGRASIVAHGFTHQRGRLNNPYNGISGDDFEFYRVTLNSDNSLNYMGPIWPDTKSQSLQRMLHASFTLGLCRLHPFAWEAPHYLASENSYLGIRYLFPVHYGRLTYFNNIDQESRAIGFQNSARLPYWGPAPRMLGQFFPFVIHKDSYGYQVIPENIGNIEPDPFEGYRPLYPEDLVRHARKALVVRDGFASFFYHPYLGTEYLRQVVDGLRELGYTFVAADTIFQ